jgi:hypothetical protein
MLIYLLKKKVFQVKVNGNLIQRQAMSTFVTMKQ